MKNIIKFLAKPVAAVSAAALLACTTGCADTSWSFKTDNMTLSNGTYIYYTYMAYGEASSKVQESSESSESSESDILSKKIDNKSAEKWIADKAKEECISQLTIDRLIKENKVNVDQSEVDVYTNYYEQFYESYSSIYEKLGVSKKSYLAATGTYTGLSDQLFYSMYDKGGSKEVPTEDIEKYFKENYTNYFYIKYPLKTTDNDGKSTDIDDSTKDNVKVNFAKYVNMLNKGSSTDDIVKQYKTDFNVTDDPSTSDTVVLTDSGMGEELQKAIKDLKEKQATVTTIGDTYYLIYKGAIADQVSTLSDTSTQINQRTKVLHKMKDDEFKSYLDEEEKKTSYETNDACLSKYSVQRTVDIIKDLLNSQ